MKFDWINFYNNLLKQICKLSENNEIASKKLYEIYVKAPDDKKYNFGDFKKIDPLTYIAFLSRNLKKYKTYLRKEFKIQKFPDDDSGIPTYNKQKVDYVYSKEIMQGKPKTNDNPDKVFDNLWNLFI